MKSKPRIFVSHSKRDTALVDWFKSACEGTGVEAWTIEHDEDTAGLPPIPSIKNEMANAVACFLLVGPNVFYSMQTSHWIAAESGLAAGLGKEVFVIEQIEQPELFTIPFVDAYIGYSDRLLDQDFLPRIVKAYSTPFDAGESPLQESTWPMVTCPNDQCSAQFRVPTVQLIDRCPVCTTNPFNEHSLQFGLPSFD